MVSTAISKPLRAVLTSPLEMFAIFLKVESSTLILYSPSPSFLSKEFFKTLKISSSESGFSLITIDLEIKALFTSK
ncbi:hypothetical protein D3C72_1238280 [compost metagenome]